MGDNYFDDKLKEILESPPSYEPDTLALQDMQRRLASARGDNDTRPGFPWRWSALLLLLLVGGGLLWQYLGDLQAKVKHLEHQLAEMSTATDTIVYERVIQHYDTIYTTVYREQYISKGEVVKPFPGFYRDQFSSLVATGFWENLSNEGFSYRTFTDQEEGSSANSSSLAAEIDQGRGEATRMTATKERFKTWTAVTPTLAQLQQKPSRLLQAQVKLGPGLPLGSYEYSTVNPLYYFSPVGLTAQVWANPVALTAGDFERTLFMAGGGVEIKLPQARSLAVGGEWAAMYFDLNDPNNFTQVPILNPTDPTDVLHEVKGRFSYLQIPVSLRQQVFTRKNWAPTISLGWVAVMATKQRLVYEYLNTQGEYKLADDLPTAPFSFRNVRVGLATQFPLGKRLVFQPEIQYQHSFEQETIGFFPSRYWAFRLGLQYDFGN